MFKNLCKKNMSILVLAAIIIVMQSVTSLFASNPLVTHMFTADPAPLVYNGRFYIFTGHDEGVRGQSGWILKEWRVLSSADMVNWTDHGQVVQVDDIWWLSTNEAWAAQCVEKDGKFYFYVCDSGAIGVLVSDNILGPYTDVLGQPLIDQNTPGAISNSDSNNNIDPSVFIDDDGQAYIYWGTDREARQAKLKDNMIEIDGNITIPQGISRFFEASWVHKRNGIYYYSYAASNDAENNWPSNIDYAISASPLGPWQYKGTLNGAAGTGTNHSGIIEFNGLWYFVYHTDYLSVGVPWQRSVSIDYLFYDTNGDMKKIVQTVNGVGGSPIVKTGTYYNIINKNSQKALEIASQSTDNGGNLQQWELGSGYHQQFEFVNAGNGFFFIKVRNSGKYIDVSGASTENGANVIQWSLHGGDNQQWRLTPVGDGYFTIVSKKSNKPLDVYEISTADGANIVQWEYWGGDGQKFKLAEVAESTSVSRMESYSHPGSYVQHSYFKGVIDSSYINNKDTQFRIVPGLADSNGVSFESVNFPGYYLRHWEYKMILSPYDGSDIFKEDATFNRAPGLANSSWTSYQSYNFPSRYLRQYNGNLQIDPISTIAEQQDATFQEQ